MKYKTKKMRKLAGLAVLCLGLSLFAACGKKADDSGQVSCKYDVQTLGERMTDVDTTLPQMKIATDSDENADMKFAVVSDLDYSLVEHYYYAYAEDGSAPEIAVVQLKNSGDASKLMESFNAHLNARKGTMAEYAPDQVELVEKAVVTNQGAYVTMIVSEKNGLVQKEFKDAF